MSKLMKLLIGVSVAAGIVMVAMVVLVKLFVTPERVKSMVLPLAEKSLGRSLTLGEVRVGLFSGIELHDLTVAERGGDTPFVAADRVLLRFQLLPLLARQVVIDEVILEKPRIRLVRHADGSLNVSDFLTPGPGASPAAVPPPADDRKAPFSVLVTVAGIRGGQLTFVDQPANAITELTELEVDASGITRDGAVPVKLSARLQGAPMQLDGVFRPLQKSAAFRADLQGLDAAAFEPYYRGKIPGKLNRLLLDLKGDFELGGRALTGRGSLHGRELDLTLQALPAAPFKNADMRSDFDLSLDQERDRLAVTSLAVTVNGLAAEVSGEVSALTTAPHGELKLSVPNLDLSQFKGVLSGKAGELDLAGRLRVSADLSGPVNQPLQMIRSGEITLDKVQATAAGVRPTIDGRILLSGETARTEAVTVRLGEIVAEIAGRADKLFDAPAVDITVNLPRVDLGKALATAPKESLKGLDEFAPSGQIEARARLVGPVAKPGSLLESGVLTLTGVQVTAGGQRPEFAGRIKLSGDLLSSEGLQVQLGGNTAQLAVTARNLFGQPVIVTADVTARRFLLEPLLQGGGGAAMNSGRDKPQAAAATAPARAPLQASGTIRIGETLWKGLAINDFVAEYALRDNQLTVSRMTGKIAGGTFSNTARVDLRRPEPAYDATLALQGVQADPLVSALAPQAAGSLSGAMTVQATVDGSGTTWEAISRTLSGEGTLTLKDGRLVSPALVQGLSTILQIPDLHEIDFSDFHGRTRIVNGKAQLDSTLAGRRLKLFPKGPLGLDGSLDLAVDTRLSPELTARLDQRGKVTRYLLDADGWAQMPLLLSGTLQSPKFGLDPKGVQAQAGKALQQELQRGLDKLLKKSEPAPAQPGESAQPPAPSQQEAPPPPPATSPAQQLLDESLKRVLGR